eukprot:Skav224866  [mRNA]  locus=scaffold1112:27149:42275:+ [translate_table: standard]
MVRVSATPRRNRSTNCSLSTENCSDRNFTGNGSLLPKSSSPSEGAAPLYGVSTTEPVGPLTSSLQPASTFLSGQGKLPVQNEDYFGTKGFVMISLLLLAFFSFTCWRSSLSEWIGGEDDDDIPIAGPLSRRGRPPPLSVPQTGNADYAQYYDMSTPRMEAGVAKRALESFPAVVLLRTLPWEKICKRHESSFEVQFCSSVLEIAEIAAFQAMATRSIVVASALLVVARAANATAAGAGSCQQYGCRLGRLVGAVVETDSIEVENHQNGYHSWMKCQCNADCERYGNCCGDFRSNCAKGSDVGSDGGDLQQAEGAICPGSIGLGGHGPIQMTNAIWNKPSDPAGQVDVNDGVIRVEMKGRTYFSNACEPGIFSHSRYAGLNLLNKRISWTTDLSAAGCGCNAAFYLASLPQNPEVSGCKDFYCDANSVCGVRCSEIDLQEANLHAFHSVLHMAEDGSGEGLGYGGGGSNWNSHRDWTREEYGPGSSCIDTTQPFQVEVSFPVEENQEGKVLMKAMVTKVSQNGCTLEASVETDSYQFNDKSSAEELTQAFENGMTPIVSYWSAPDMLWMDGQGADQLGPCEQDQPDLCGEAVKFYDFSVEGLSQYRI